jgi:hypothetical protein
MECFPDLIGKPLIPLLQAVADGEGDFATALDSVSKFVDIPGVSVYDKVAKVTSR